MMFTDLILIHGLIYTGGFAFIILLSVLINPRIWMQDFPEELKKVIPPKSNLEIKQTFITGFLFSLFIIGFPLFSVAVKVNLSDSAESFQQLFLHSFLVMMICNTLYWLIFDLLIFNVVISRLRTVPGIRNMFRFSGWKRQIFGLLVGILTSASISLIVGYIALAFS